MRQSEISLGEVLALVRRHSGSISVSGVHARVIEKSIPGSRWSDRKDHVRVLMLNEDGSERLHSDENYISEELRGTPVYKNVPARELISLAEEEAILAKEREARERRQMIQDAQDALRNSVYATLFEAFGVGEDDVTVQVRWDNEKEISVIQMIAFHGEHGYGAGRELRKGVDALNVLVDFWLKKGKPLTKFHASGWRLSDEGEPYKVDEDEEIQDGEQS